MRRPKRRSVGELPGIHATTPLMYKYAHEVFTRRRSFSAVPFKTSLSILDVKFLNAWASKVHTFSVYRGSMWTRISNMRHRTSSTPAPPPTPASLHADLSDMMDSCAGSSDIFVDLRLHDFQLHLSGLYDFAFKFFVENRYNYLR